MKLLFDSETMAKVEKIGEELFISPEAADKIALFEEEYKYMTNFRKELLHDIELKALEFDPNFKSLTSDSIKLIYAAHGSRFAIDDSLLSGLSVDFYSTETKYKPNVEAIESYAKEHKGLPLGIIEPERKKSITVRLTKGDV